MSKLKGETKLVKLLTGYRDQGKDKRAAYEIEVGSGPLMKHDTIFITRHLGYRGFKYFPDREGYSVLAILFDHNGRELYGAHIPLQSLKQKDGAYLYTIGTKEGPSLMAFPSPPVDTQYSLNISYKPDPNVERGGEVLFEVYPPGELDASKSSKAIASGKTAVGEKFNVGNHLLSVKEIRYWAAMSVRYDPGQPIVLASLWIGLFGVTLTTLARIFRKKKVQSLPS
jgi:hypothetical protein